MNNASESITTSGTLDHRVPDDKTLLDAFSRAEFALQEGKFLPNDMVTLCEQGKIIIANGNNYGNPYLACLFPKAPGQEVDNEVPDSEGYGRGFRIGANEAIVIVGDTPPEMQYFSFAAFVASTYWAGKRADPPVLVPLAGTHLRTIVVGDRRQVFFSVGDTINCLTIKTPAGLANPCVSVFEKRFMIIFTADAATEATIRDIAASVGFPRQAINLKVLPADLARLGIDKNDDTFGIGQRLSFDGNPEHLVRAKEYADKPPVRVFRLTPPKGVALQPLPLPPIRVRGTGRTELGLWPAVRELREAIVRAYPDYVATDLTTTIWINESYEILQQGLDALGESRDTSYLSTESFVLPDDPDTFIIVYGVNHAAAGKAVYSNVVVYGEARDNGVASVSSNSYAGSANRYLPGCPDADKLYAWKVTRRPVGSEPCLLIPLPPADQKLHGVAPEAAMYLGFRAYLEPETKVGPAWHELVFDRAIKLTKKGK